MEPTYQAPDASLSIYPEDQLPRLYANEQSDASEVQVRVKFFTPRGPWTWYFTEYSDLAPDKTPHLGFGYVVSDFDQELGYISLDEMRALPAGWVERDMYFGGCTLQDVLDGKRP